MSSVLSCGVIPVRRQHGSWEYLLLRCYKYWDFPKGLNERGEDALTTARRELREETGLTNVTLDPDVFTETEPYAKNKIARYYLGIITDPGEVHLTPNPETGILEHHEFRWLPMKAASALIVPRLKTVLEWADLQLRDSSFQGKKSR